MQQPPPRSPIDDTSPEAEALVLDRLRRMSPAEKLHRVMSLNRALEAFAAARLRKQYGPDLSSGELKLRIAALQLDRDTMIAAFGWDPEIEGY